MRGIEMPKFITPRSRRILRRTFFVLLFFVAILVSAGYVLSHIAENKIEQLLQRVGGKIGSIDINLLLQRVTVTDIQISPVTHTTSVPTNAHIQKVVLKNINPYRILVHGHLEISELLIEEGSVVYNKKLKFESEQDSTGSTSPLQKITIDNIILRNIEVAIVSDSIPEYSGLISLNLKKLQSSTTTGLSELQDYTLKNFDASVTKVTIHDKSGLYTIKIGKVTASSDKKNLSIDSLLITPQHSKFKFSRIVGKQTDRINAFIRSILIKGIRFDQMKDSAFVASTIDIADAEVYSFRDKRMPFRETKNKPLPMEALKNLSIAVEIDSFKIRNTKITYEEYPEEGFESGKVTFEDLEAKLINLSNRKYYNKPDFATLTASAKLMGKGLIEASFFLPLDDKPYRAQGRINTMFLYHLNPALENLAFISIESGRLNEIDFDFNYTNDISNGSLTIDYENLKINGLKKEKDVSVNDLKTLVINTLIKNDKDKSVPTNKRTGSISFERDKHRQIFNYWWKSLLSGIKGSVLSIADKKSNDKNQKDSPK